METVNSAFYVTSFFLYIYIFYILASSIFDSLEPFLALSPLNFFA